MMLSQWIGLAVLLAVAAFLVFAFRQGEKVRRPPEGTPPESTGGYGQ